MGKPLITKPDFAVRLESARERRGFSSARAAAEYFGWKYDSYVQHERGERGIKKVAKRYAKAFRVSEAWLLTGEGAETEVDVVGIVGAGGEVAYDTAIDGERDTVPRPSGAPPDAVAVEIRGDSLGPGFDRWYAIYARREDPITAALINQLCVVGTADGRTLIKWVRLGREGYNLQSGTGAIEENVNLAWGARVLTIQARP